MNFIKKITDLFSQPRAKNFAPQTFTYFVAAPKQNRSGYREKNFDRLTYEFLQRGYEVLDLKTQSLPHAQTPGLWVILLVRPLNQSAAEFDAHSFGPEILEESSPAQTGGPTIELDTDEHEQDEDEVEGLYYIDKSTRGPDS